MPSLDLHFRGTVISLPRLVLAVACLFALIAGGARLVRGEPTQTAQVLGPLNVRSGPGTEHPVVTHAGAGARIQVTRPDADGWAAVRDGRRTVGYVRALPRYVRMEPDAARGSGLGAAWWLFAALAAAGAWAALRGRSGRAPAPASTAPRPDIAAPLPDSAPGWDDTLVAPPFPHPAMTHSVSAGPTAKEKEREAERNGRDFESWAAVRVKRSGLALVDWRSDKYVEGVYAEANLAPDLLVEYREGGERIPFAVECKWRSRYYQTDKLQWGEWRHLNRYRKYAIEHGTPVYLLIGVGGTGAEPRDVYLVPLERVEYPWLYERELREN
ncbi:MAG TPA: SH3 domain-containing protein [Longimicrobium sp.]|nr:SH3 domain-containing protein [Longimicrobium sp.]